MPKESPTGHDDLAKRLEIVKGMVVEGKPQSVIVNHCLEHYAEWRISARQLRNYVHMAKKQLAKSAPHIDIDTEFMLAKLRNDLLFNTSFEAKDYKAALSANMENIKLMQLNSPRFKRSWQEKFASAGINPESAMDQFIGILKQEATKADGNR